MIRTIDANALKEAFWDGVYNGVICDFEDTEKLIDNAPTIDAEPVVHGQWRLNKQYGDYECSVCEQGDVTAPHFITLKMNYCPNCGAKMDGERKET